MRYLSISTAGLRPTAEGVRVRLRGGKLKRSSWPSASCGSTARNGTSNAKCASSTGPSSA